MKKLINFASKYDMLPKDAYVLCAVSGGADSMCMLSILNDIASGGSIRVAAAHFDHGLRGPESDRDAEFVRNFCAEHDIAFFYGAGNVSEYAKSKGRSIETAAREMRYDFLSRTAEKIGANRIATAHTADDNAETVLMNLIRGSGLKGLCGIPPIRGNIIRPLLCMTREQVMDYLSEHKIPHVEDSTNLQQVYTRNKLRHSVIPLLKEFNPNLLETISDTAELLIEDEAYLGSLAEKALWQAKREVCGLRLSVEEFRALPRPVAARVILGAAEEIGAGLTRNLVEGATELAYSSSPSARRSFSGGLTVIREYGDLIFTRLPVEVKTFSPVKLELNKTVEVPELGLGFTYAHGVPREKIHNSFNTFLFKKDAICGSITVRPRKSGDKITFWGKSGSKTIKKLFIDKKLPLRFRESVPVLADEKGVIAVPGFGMDQRCVPSPGDKLISITIDKIGGETDNAGVDR